MADFFPTDLSIGHLHRTWLYWLLLILLAGEFVWMCHNAWRYRVAVRKLSATPSGPWGKTTMPSRFHQFLVRIQMVIGGLSVLALLLASAVAFYLILLSLLSTFVRFVQDMRAAHTSETIGSAIGSWIGASLQLLAVLGVIASVDPTNGFPLQLHNYLSERTSP